MNLVLYYNSSEKNKVGKSLNNPVSLDGNIRGESNVVNPTIRIRSSNPINSNYCYIESFKRYYFIKEIRSVRTGIWELDLSVDVLESFKGYFMNLNCIIEKTSELSKSNTNFNDGSYLTSEETFNEVINFPNSVFLEKPSFILTCV